MNNEIRQLPSICEKSYLQRERRLIRPSGGGKYRTFCRLFDERTRATDPNTGSSTVSGRVY
jgi:hypothetical protein